MRNKAAPSACLGPAYTFKKQSRGLKYKKMLTGRNLVAAGISENMDIFRALPPGLGNKSFAPEFISATRKKRRTFELNKSFLQ
jgi:hypothetical protein